MPVFDLSIQCIPNLDQFINEHAINTNNLLRNLIL